MSEPAMSTKNLCRTHSDVVFLHTQRSTRLIATLALFAATLSEQAGSRLLTQVGIALSSATLLRLAKQMEVPFVVTPRVLGVDDFAFRRGRPMEPFSSTWKHIVPLICFQNERHSIGPVCIVYMCDLNLARFNS